MRRKVHKGRKSDNRQVQRDFGRFIAPNYATPEISIVSGKGAYLKDSDGRSYLDFLSGIATNALGAAHPAIIKAVSRQVALVSHVSNFYAHPESVRLAGRLQSMSGDGEAKVFFCNSGAEANEAAIKLSRLSGREEIIAMRGAFHGRTIGALSLTGQAAKQQPFLPLMPGVRFVDYDDAAGLKRAVSKRTAMVIVEPIQGENGVVVPRDGYLSEVEQIARGSGALLAIDAVQTGMGRTGQWFGFEDQGIRPDLITLAKGLGGGLPMGAMIALSGAPQFAPGQHGSTFGGNPVVAAAANAVLDIIEREELMVRALELHNRLRDSLSELSGILEIRGKGLLIGIVLRQPDAKKIVSKLQESGVLANAATEYVIRLAPPLIVTSKEVDRFIRVFREVVLTAEGGRI